MFLLWLELLLLCMIFLPVLIFRFFLIFRQLIFWWREPLFGTSICFCWNHKGDELYWTVSSRDFLLLSGYYSSDLMRSWRWQSTLDCEIPSMPDTLWMLHARLVFIARSTDPGSTVTGLPDLAWSLKFLQTEWNFFHYLFTVLWSAALSHNQYFPSTNVLPSQLGL